MNTLITRDTVLKAIGLLQSGQDTYCCIALKVSMVGWNPKAQKWPNVQNEEYIAISEAFLHPLLEFKGWRTSGSWSTAACQEIDSNRVVQNQRIEFMKWVADSQFNAQTVL